MVEVVRRPDDVRGHQPAPSRRKTAIALRSRSPKPAAIALRTDHVEGGQRLSHRRADAFAQPGDQLEILRDEIEAERHGGGLGMLVGRPLVLHERSGRGAAREDLVGDLAVDAGAFGEHERLGEGDVQAVHEVVHRELRRGAGPPAAEVDHLGGEGVEHRPTRSSRSASPPTMIVSAPASTVLTLPETGQSRNPAPVASTAAPTRSTVRGSTVLVSTATDRRADALDDAVRARGTRARAAASSARLVMTTSALGRLGSGRCDRRSASPRPRRSAFDAIAVPDPDVEAGPADGRGHRAAHAPGSDHCDCSDVRPPPFSDTTHNTGYAPDRPRSFSAAAHSRLI